MGSNIHRTRPAARSGMGFRVIAAAIAGCLAHGAAYANPQGGVVTNGQATFNTQGNVFTITNTPGTIINWQNFSINANETTRFLQQSASSAVLNRIVGQDPSQILGALQSNGKVFLINPNGILFGRGARVDTSGLVASTLDIGNQDFLSGKMKFTAGANAGSVENQGTISTPSGGQVYLIAPSVTNSGIITSPQGEVVLAAGRSVQLVDSGDPDLHVVVSAPQDRALNLGQIIAHSGKVGIYGALIDQNGTVNADSAVVGKNGKIVFKASGDTILGDGSHTSATGAGSGGTVHVLGERVGLAGSAQVDASGRTGGGTVLVGGDYHGENPAIQDATRTYVGSNAQIKADATESGNGGKVIVWSDEMTRDYGSISARGGAQGGNGGFVESSGKETLDHHAKVDVSAPKGKGGTLLLDPATITLVGGTGDGAASPDGTTTFQGGATPGTVNFADSDMTSAGVSNIYQSELEGLAPGTNIILEATDYITATGTFSNLVTLPTNSNLTMRTRNASTDGSGTIGIDLVSSVDASNLEFRTQGTGTITLQTGTGASPQAATINVGKLTTAGGSITLNASGNVAVGGVTTTPAFGNGGNISLTSGGSMALGGGADIDARGSAGANGNVMLKSGGPISLQNGNTIYGNQLTMIAAGGISGTASFDPMLTHINSLNATNTGSGSITIFNTGSNLSIADLASTGYGVKNFASGGGISISTDTGETLNVDAPISANNGLITLSGDGSINLAAVVNAGGDSGTTTPVAFGNGASGGDGIRLAAALAQGPSSSANVALFSNSGAVLGTGIVSGSSLDVQANNGISLQTKVGFLSATNESGSNPISITNVGTLHLENFSQSGSGGILIDNTGPLFVDQCDCNFFSQTGDIVLTAHSPLTVNGSVNSSSGNITLNAGATGAWGAGDTLTINGYVSTSGNVTLTAGDSIVIASTATLNAGGTLSQTSSLNLPTLATCTTAPTTAGCSLVLPSLSACVASPTTAGCSAVLPSIGTCVASPTTAGCSVVLPSLSICVTSPATAGCSAVLPSIGTCVASPATAGCSVVLPTLSACTANPSLQGCSVVLPSVDQCTADPTLPGCTVVLPAKNSPTGGISQAIQTTIGLLNTSTNAVTGDTAADTADSGEQAGKKKEAGDHTGGSSKDSGAKHNEHTEKMYCN